MRQQKLKHRNNARIPKAIHSTPAHPEDFGQARSPLRERMARAVKEMEPEVRLRGGR